MERKLATIRQITNIRPIDGADMIEINKLYNQDCLATMYQIDDDSDMLYRQKNHFVHVLPSPRNKDGFNQHYYEIAKSMLEKTIIESLR